MNRRSLRPLLPAAVFVLLATLLFSPRAVREMPDFEVYWRAAVRAAAGEPLYRAEDEHYQFKYLPAFAVLAVPIGLLPLAQAKVVWLAASIGLLLSLIALSLRLPVERRKPAWAISAVLIVSMGKFYGHELVLGQVNLLFAVIVVGALLLLRNGREALAGLLTAVAIVVKPYAVLFLPWLVAQGRARASMAAGAGLAGALTLPLAVYSAGDAIALHAEWWRTVTASTAPNLLNQDNVSLAAMFAKWIGPGGTASWLAAAAGGLLLIVAAAVFVRRRGMVFPEGLEGALLLTLIPLLSPQGWDYVFLIATPAVALLANDEDRLPVGLRVVTIAALATIGLSLFDVMGRAGYARFMALSVLTVCFLVVVAALAALRVRQVA